MRNNNNKVEAASNRSFKAFVMGYFTESPNGNGDEHSLHMAYSYDGLHWIPFNDNRPVLEPEIGEKGLRDPYIYRKNDGTFVILATNMWNSEYIMCYDSTDLVTFTEGRLLRMNDSAMHAWAPEVFYDTKFEQYGIIWSGNTDRNRIYVNYTSDFMNVSKPEVYFDPGYNVIDASIVSHDDVHYLYYKDERDANEPPYEGKRVKIAKSESLKPRSFDSNLYLKTIGDPQFEAPLIVKSNDIDKWYLYGDNYYPSNGKFYVWETDDLSEATWLPLNRRNYNAPLNAKHASVVEIDQHELDNLIQYWGKKPKWNRIKSFQNPDYYVTSEDGFAKLESYPFDPYEHSQWKLVEGLADSDAVSFESIAYPNYYLKAYNFVLRLEKLDGSEEFKQEATFKKINGLSGVGGTSFISYKHPHKYIKQDGAFLRVSEVTTDTEKQAATFDIGW
ncbi:AbfB domain-containing protein [Aquibacillus albus]|uniref:Family 43 glycosylhydrolase n=1 Tax=Aquibacillus albus TaxID=1168171 RepID=A0ABS2MXS9_9BACI|nr:AbfB domain-containing protein [Aquibacillus albus]MBM7570687.1 hypothetical protein [Aquibacillus albus]